jgi:hypothetical protein
MAFSSQVIDVPLVTDTAIYAGGDVLVATQAISVPDAPLTLQSLTIFNRTVAQSITTANIYFMDANVSFGAANAVVTLSAANALNILGVVAIADTDFSAAAGILVLSRAASYKNIGIVLKPEASTGSIYTAIVLLTGTPTLAANALHMRLGLVSAI